MLDLLHKNFDTTTASLLETGDKIIDQIQKIFQSKKAKSLSKLAIGDNSNLVRAFKDKNMSKKVNSNSECYNYYKLGHFGQDYSLPYKKLNRNTQQFQRKQSQKKDSQGKYQNEGQNDSKEIANQAHQASENKDDSNSKLFILGAIRTAFMVKKQRNLQKTLRSSFSQFLDLCAFQYLYNN